MRLASSLPLALGDAGVEREDDGGADEEEEVGEDEVGEGEAVPGGVVELGVGVGPVAGVVDEDHEGDGEAAEDVDGEDAIGEAADVLAGTDAGMRWVLCIVIIFAQIRRSESGQGECCWLLIRRWMLHDAMGIKPHCSDTANEIQG